MLQMPADQKLNSVKMLQMHAEQKIKVGKNAPNARWAKVKFGNTVMLLMPAEHKLLIFWWTYPAFLSLLLL